MKLQLKLLAPIIIFSLVATGFGVWSFNDAVTTNRQVPIGLEEMPIEPEGYYKVDEYEPYSLKKVSDGNLWSTPKLTGNQKVLVIPVQLQGTTWTSAMLSRLNTAFFGASEETSWESVSSYYTKSSYGQFNLIGEITNVLNISYTPEQLVSTFVSTDYPQNHVAYVANEFYKQASAALLQEYDQDGNGYVDMPYFIYANDFDTPNYWAWVYWLSGYQSGIDTFQPYKLKPRINTHMWASYEALSQGYGTSGIDSHMLIHETGHMLGLSDYYDYDGNSAPMGSVDMMDLNIIDHNAYSKAALEWVKPYYVDGTKDVTTITINSFTETGDFILVNDSWNGHALDEYLTIELYTPTGLNKKDSDAPYPYRSLQAFTEPGVRIIHVDSRTYNFTGDKQYTDTPVPSKTRIAASNSDSRNLSPGKQYKLAHMIQAGGVDTFSTTYRATATNADLFHQGDTFEASNAFFVKGKNFNEGNKVGYRIKVESLTATQATISFTKI